MIFTVSSAAAALRSTQNTCAPSRAKVTAVALPLPQPGPIEPAPTTIAVLPLSRSIAFSRYLFCHVSQTRMAITLALTGYPKIPHNVQTFSHWQQPTSPRSLASAKPARQRPVHELGERQMTVYRAAGLSLG